MEPSESIKLVITLSGAQAQQLRDIAERECLPMTTLAKSIILKHLAQLQCERDELRKPLIRAMI